MNIKNNWIVHVFPRQYEFVEVWNKVELSLKVKKVILHKNNKVFCCGLFLKQYSLI